MTQLPTAVQQVTDDMNALNTAASQANTMHGMKDVPADVKSALQTQESGLVAASKAAELWIAGQTPIPPIRPVLTVPAGYSASDLILDDTFATYDSSIWNKSIGSGQYGIWPVGPKGSGLSTPGNQYNAAYFSPANLNFGRPNGLDINCVRDTSIGGYSFRSGCLSSYRLWALKEGYIQWLAMFPDMSTGAWPGLWLLDGLSSGHDSNPPSEQDAYEGGYANSKSKNPNLAFASNSHGSGNTQVVADAPSTLAGTWQVVGCNFVPGKSFTTYLNGKQIANFTKNVTTDALEILINLQMAQNASPWHTNVSAATPNGIDMTCGEVQVYGEAA